MAVLAPAAPCRAGGRCGRNWSSAGSSSRPRPSGSGRALSRRGWPPRSRSAVAGAGSSPSGVKRSCGANLMVRSASPGSIAGRALPKAAQADHLAVRDALRDHHVHVAAGREPQCASWPRSPHPPGSRSALASTSSPFCGLARVVRRCPSAAGRNASPKNWEKISSAGSAPRAPRRPPGPPPAKKVKSEKSC